MVVVGVVVVEATVAVVTCGPACVGNETPAICGCCGCGAGVGVASASARWMLAALRTFFTGEGGLLSVSGEWLAGVTGGGMGTGWMGGGICVAGVGVGREVDGVGAVVMGGGLSTSIGSSLARDPEAFCSGSSCLARFRAGCLFVAGGERRVGDTLGTGGGNGNCGPDWKGRTGPVEESMTGPDEEGKTGPPIGVKALCGPAA